MSGVAARGRVRDADATRARIVKADKGEFARLGLGGARVDAIARRAKANKRMIYHYFTSKEDLFRAVLEEAYLDIRAAEQKLDLDGLPPEEALAALVTFTWHYYLKHPEFLTLVNSENLHKARHLKRSPRMAGVNRPLLELIERILARGVAAGAFRAGVDPMQLAITIAAVNYYYLTNRHTGAIVYGRDLMSQTALTERIAFNIETVLRLVRVG